MSASNSNLNQFDVSSGLAEETVRWGEQLGLDGPILGTLRDPSGWAALS